jgi:hypothetical protein
VANLIDPSGDFAVVDGLERVVYYRRTGNNTFDQGTVCNNVLMRDVVREEVQSGGATLSRVKSRFHVWKADLAAGGGPGPKVNDVIQQGDGTRWSVADVDEGTFQTRWLIHATRER